MKYLIHYLAVGVLIVVGIIFISSRIPANEPQLGGINRTVSYATSTVATSTVTQVLAPNTRAVYRRITSGPLSVGLVHCFAAATSTVVSTSTGGIVLASTTSYVFSSKEGNLWSGPISCVDVSGAAYIYTQENYE
jgi:hypothetical protein